MMISYCAQILVCIEMLQLLSEQTMWKVTTVRILWINFPPARGEKPHFALDPIIKWYFVGMVTPQQPGEPRASLLVEQ